MSRDRIEGTFHFHSTYSHDGRSTLPEIVSTLRGLGFSFCIMTEHFEDFDAATFRRYAADVDALNRRSDGFVLVAGVEVSLSGIDTILFPARSYDEIVKFSASGLDENGRMFKVVAHPSKYAFDAIARHLDRYAIDGIELWNQQADGRHFPQARVLDALRTHPARNSYRYFFGCDIHDVTLTVTNVVSLPRPARLTPDAIVAEVTGGDFLARSLSTGIDYQNGPGSDTFDSWVEHVSGRASYRAKALQGVRSCLKGVYNMLPRDMRHSLNDFKNLVRNKV